MFEPISRYADLEELEIVDEGGRTIRYVARRFLPDPDALEVAGQVAVRPPDRPDLLARRVFDDPLQYYRLCDANGVMHPNELTERERRLRVPTRR